MTTLQKADKQKIYMVECKCFFDQKKDVISKTALGVAVLNNGKISCRKYAELCRAAGRGECIPGSCQRMETEDGRVARRLDNGGAIFLGFR